MAIDRKRGLNPELEELRKDVPEPPDINEIIKDLITTPKIHAGFLYYKEGCLLRQTLCLWLSSTRSTLYYSGWEDFGIKLGLDPILIQNIKCSLTREDPTSYVLLAYVQYDNATVEDILRSLLEINRCDVLFNIKHLVKNLNDAVLVQFSVDDKTDIIRPERLPNCPFVLKNIKTLKETYIERKLITELKQKSIPFTSEPRSNPVRFWKTILLTYSSDASDIADECLKHLRKPRDNLRLGVVVLNEHELKINTDSEQFVLECFAQVDYVFPIITMRYLQEIISNATNNESALENVDHKYVKYIYKLMNTHYLRNGCRNTKVRCLIPDEEVKTVLKHPIMNQSLFQVWVRTKDIDKWVDQILKSRI